MPDDHVPRRHWFRFGLRTMFVVLTVFSLWFGWQAKIVRERREALAAMQSAPDHSAKHGFVTTWAIVHSNMYFHGGKSKKGYSPLPIWRTWLGDESISSIWLVRRNPELESIRKLFPEADLHFWDDESEEADETQLLCELTAIGEVSNRTGIATDKLAARSSRDGKYRTVIVRNSKAAPDTEVYVFFTEDGVLLRYSDGTVTDNVGQK